VVEYPGRGTREGEAPWDEVPALATAAGEATAELLDRPFAVLGYSLGALVAYEWLRALQRSGGPAPLRFLPCARRAPHLPGRLPPLHQLPLDRLVAALQERFEPVPELLLGEPELLEQFLAPLRADLRAVERYAWAPGEPLRGGVHALGGSADPDVSAEELSAWSRHTLGPFQAEQLAGGHFLLGSPRLRQVAIEACLGPSRPPG